MHFQTQKKIGLILLILPFISIPLVLVLFPILNYFLASSASELSTVISMNEPNESLRTTINAVLGAVGLLSIFMPIVGIYLIQKANKFINLNLETFDIRSGKKELSEIPDEINHWSWGAAGFGLVWGIYHNVWISLLGLLPVVNWFFWIIIGIKGNKWAWQNLKWESVESFQAKQKAWNIFGFLMFFIPILFFAVGAGVYLSYLENKPASPYYQSSISVNN